MFEKQKSDVDTRLSGIASEYILSCVLRNKYGLITQKFDVEGFDIISFDPDSKLFHRGKSPFYIQVKTRGKGNPTGISTRDYEKLKELAGKLSIPLDSVYIAFGSFPEDIRKIKFFIIPLERIPELCMSKKGVSYRFRVKQLEMLRSPDVEEL